MSQDNILEIKKKHNNFTSFIVSIFPGTKWDHLQDQVSARTCVVVIGSGRPSLDCLLDSTVCVSYQLSLINNFIDRTLFHFTSFYMATTEVISNWTGGESFHLYVDASQTLCVTL